MKKNDSEHYESVEIALDPIKFPIAYAAKVNELIDCGFSKEEAEKEALRPIEMELYYENGLGLMLVESEAVESTPIYSPYTKEQYEEYEE